MQKYFLNDGSGQQGPFSLEELKDKNLLPTTPIWYDGLEKWTTAGELPELKDILVHMPPPFEASKPAVTETPVTTPPVAETTVTVSSEPVVTIVEKPVETVVAAAPAQPMSSTPIPAAAPPSHKKSTAWISWAVGVLLLGGTGYYIYQDIEKNKDNTGTAQMVTPTSDTAAKAPVENGGMTSTTTNNADTASTPATTPATDATTPANTPATDATTPTATTTPATTPATTTPATTPGASDKDKAAAAAKAKADAAAKAKADAIAKAKADDLKKKQQAATAAQAAKEAMMRNNWPRYITIGNIDYKSKDDGLDNFLIPVYNGTDAVLDRVTLKVDYLKKEGKVIKTEIITVDNVPTHGGKNANAPENKKARKVNVYITGISSRGLHFCYPTNNGNAADPYYCK